jgi:hypothetical protein
LRLVREHDPVYTGIACKNEVLAPQVHSAMAQGVARKGDERNLVWKSSEGSEFEVMKALSSSSLVSGIIQLETLVP